MEYIFFLIAILIILLLYTSRTGNFHEEVMFFSSSNTTVETSKYSNKPISENREYENILVITLNEPSRFMLDRAKEYQKYRSNTFDVWYIFDATIKYEIPSEYKLYFEKNVYKFNSSDFTTTYPHIKDLLLNCGRAREYEQGLQYRYIAYMTMAERINEMYLKNKLKTKYLWILEQDAGVTGNLEKMIRKFDNYSEDFISRDLELNTKSYKKFFRNYYYYSQCLSDVFKDYLIGKPVYKAHIFFSRFSKRYMEHLNRYINLGYHGNSELMYPTIAFLNNLSMTTIPESLIYKKSNWDTDFTKKEFYSLSDSELFIHRLKE